MGLPVDFLAHDADDTKTAMSFRTVKRFACLVIALCNPRLRLLLLLTIDALILAPTPSGAVILYGTGDPSANTSAPTGALAGSGWQYEGQFAGVLGTVIASNYFITAKHVGGSVG